MKLTIIIIGDEILLGQVIDTNSGEIARMLGPRGWQVVETLVVGDDGESIKDAVAQAMSQSQLVITTGGLGPTKDDITKKVLCDYFGGTLQENAEVLANVKKVFEKRGLPLNEYTCQQALVPTSCKVIQNKYGTAPIMWFEQDGKVLVSMPGVPFETVGMMRDVVADAVCRRFSADISYAHHTLIVSGIAESALAMEIADWESALPQGVHLAYLPVPGYIRLRIDAQAKSQAKADELCDEYARQLKGLVSKYLVYDGDASLAQILLEKLKGKGLTVGTAESCTGGNIAHQITMVPGSSENFYGGVVSYDNSVKIGVLGVDANILATEGAVSEPVVRQMAQGASRVLGTDCAMATSGIAGPGGAVPGKPVGTVWMAVHTPNGTTTALKHFPGNRERVIERATAEVMLMLIKAIEENA